MSNGKTQKKPLTPEDRKLFMEAMEEFNTRGTCSVKCNECQSTIKFEKRGSATVHECNCGKFSGSLRGL